MQTIERVSNSESIVVSVGGITDALGGVNMPTLALRALTAGPIGDDWHRTVLGDVVV